MTESISDLSLKVGRDSLWANSEHNRIYFQNCQSETFDEQVKSAIAVKTETLNSGCREQQKAIHALEIKLSRAKEKAMMQVCDSFEGLCAHIGEMKCFVKT